MAGPSSYNGTGELQRIQWNAGVRWEVEQEGNIFQKVPLHTYVSQCEIPPVTYLPLSHPLFFTWEVFGPHS